MSPKRTNNAMRDTSCGRGDATDDIVSRYMREIEQRRRLTRDEETTLVLEIIRRREEIAELLRAVLLKACDTLACDSDDRPTERARSRHRTVADRTTRPLEAYLGELPRLRAPSPKRRPDGIRGLRTAIASLVDKTRLRSLESKIVGIAAIARRELQALRQDIAAGASTRAGRLLADIGAGFGMSAEDIDRVATAIQEHRQMIEQAKNRLVESNLRLVVYFARRAKWRGADIADLIQEGNIALMNAVESFDPDRGLAFGTFATIGVQRAIHRFGACARNLVRVPEDVRARRLRVRKTADYLSNKEGVAPSWDAVAKYLDVSKEEVAAAFEDTNAWMSLDAATDESAPLMESVPDESVVDVADVLAASEEDRLVRAEIARLDERRRRVIEAKYNIVGDESSSLAEIGREFGVTRERARQIESSALRALRTRQSAAHRTHPRVSAHRKPRRKPRAF